MLNLVFSKSAIIFYIFVILTELVTKHGLQEVEIQGKSNFLKLGDLCGICAGIFLIFYSINTVWWAFIILLIIYVGIYQFLRFFISLAWVNKKYIRIISAQGKYFLIPIAILMFLLVRK